MPSGEEEVLFTEGQGRQEDSLQDAEVSCYVTTGCEAAGLCKDHRTGGKQGGLFRVRRD